VVQMPAPIALINERECGPHQIRDRLALRKNFPHELLFATVAALQLIESQFEGWLNAREGGRVNC